MKNNLAIQKIEVNAKLISRLLFYGSYFVVYLLYKISRMFSEPLGFKLGMMNFLAYFFLAFILFIIIHELIHIVTLMILTKCKFSDFKMGFNLKFFIVYISPKIDIPAQKYKVILLMPFFILFPISLLLYLWIFPGMISSLILTMTLLGSGFDLIWFFKLRKYDNNYLVMEDDSNPGLLNIKKVDCFQD